MRFFALVYVLPLLPVTSCSEAALDPGEAPDLFTVQRGSLRITVEEPAEIKAARETRVQSRVEGTATVIYLIEEGSIVEKGTKLVELDVSSLLDRKANQEIALERAEAALVQAEQNLAIQMKEIRAAEENARSKVRIAEMELEKFLGKPPEQESGADRVEGTNREMLAKLEELVKGTVYRRLPDQLRKHLLPTEQDLSRNMGELAQKILQQVDQIRLAEAELKVKEETLAHSKRLAEKDYVTKNELDKDRLAYESQLSKVTLAWNELDLLISYSLRKDEIRLRQDLQNARLEFQRVQANNKARRAREEAELRSRRAERDLAKERYENLVRQIENAVIYAPTPGLVVYATQGDGRRGFEVVEEGQQVRQRQTLIVLPDVSRMVADLKVKEADVDKVAPGQRCVIRVDTFPDTPFTGRVQRVSPLPDSGSRWSNNDLKVYKTRVEIDGVNRVLRPGMSARVEIVIAEIPDALYVPLQAVRRQGRVHYVWKLTTDGPIAQRVTVGHNNLTHVQILEGLAEGDRVYLAPPAGVEVPEFEQPPAPSPGRDKVGRKARPAEAAARKGGRAPRLGMSSSAGAQLREKLLAKHPELAETLQGDPRALFRDERVREAIRSDPELRTLSERIRAEMRARFGGKGRRRGGGQRDGKTGRGAGDDR